MRQRIGFVDTRDGRVAYATVGSGSPVLCDTGWVSHLEFMWRGDIYRSFFERIAAEHTLIRYDKPGTGLSDRSRPEVSFAAEVRAIEAIVDALGLEQLSLIGMSQGGAATAMYAARHPERVDRLLLYGTFARGQLLATPDVAAAIVSLVRAHWGIGSRTLADTFIAGADAVVEDWFVRMQRTAAEPEMAARLLEECYATDVSADLARVRAPTLVLHRDRDRAIAFSAGREVAALVPGAAFHPLEGRAHIAYVGDTEPVLAAILEFLAGPAKTPLTPREIEVALRIAAGDTNAEIAHRLAIAPKTVDAHVEHIRNKLGVRSRTQIGVWAAEQGLRGPAARA